MVVVALLVVMVVVPAVRLISTVNYIEVIR